MANLRFYCFTLLWTLVFSQQEIPHPLSDEFIDSINREQSNWRAERTFPVGTTMEDVKRLMGGRRSDSTQVEMKRHDPELIAKLPDSFDPKEKWPNCHTLDDIRDQGNCGSCYVFGSVEAMTDRYCTLSNRTKQFYFSADDVVSCCWCGGCMRGFPECVYREWKSKGIVSGGAYNSSHGCRPYEIPPCETHKQGLPCTNKSSIGPPPKCVKSCIQGYPTTYKDDLRFGKNYYTISGEDDLKAELYSNGPVTAYMNVYDDFLSYKSGVYQYVRGNIVGGHIVKILGWGEEKGVKYWRVANSWNVEWGEKGFFRILRGKGECLIDSAVAYAGFPLFPTNE